MDDEVHSGNYSDKSDAVQEKLRSVEISKAADASSDKKRYVFSDPQWFVDLYDEDHAVDQWGNEWEGETY